MNATGNENSEKTLLEPLTRREQQILDLLAEGLTSGEMAERLTLAVSSVRWYIQQIYSKLGVNSKRQAISQAIRLGLLNVGTGKLTAFSEFPSQDTKTRPSHNLPLELTPFIGRQREISQVQELLRVYRLVTLTGSGGVGKTRLSIQVARRMLEESPNGVWYVELAPISDPELVPQILAAALGLRDNAKQPMLDTLIHFLSARDLIIVLDNCEHLLEACARLADALLRKAPRLRLLVSSREALGIEGEYPFRVPSLTIPVPLQSLTLDEIRDTEAVRLFTERARLVLADLTVDEGNARFIVQICHRLDGIPLALELAAARLNILTIEQLASRLDNAFQILTGGSRSALPRQQTLRAAIEWSHNLLSTPEQILLRRLAVFTGGCTLEAIESVCAGEGLETGQIIDLLGGLVNKSMISAEHEHADEIRYRPLETVRQFARERLLEAGENYRIFDRHLDYYLDLVETIEPQLRTTVALDRLRTLEHEIANLRTALSWAFDALDGSKIEAELRLASALLNLWLTQNYLNEGSVWLIKGLSVKPVIPVDRKVRAKACFAVGYLLILLGRLAEAEQWMEESFSISSSIEDTNGIVMALSKLALIYAWSGSFEKANQVSTQSLVLVRSLNDRWLLAWVLSEYAMCLFLQGERALLRPYFEESLTIFEQLGDQLQIVELSGYLGIDKFERGDLSGARTYFMKALVSNQAKKSKFGEAQALAWLGIMAYMQGDYHQMRKVILESVAMQRQMGSTNLGDALLLLGIAEINLVHPGLAAPLFKECLLLAWVSEDYADNPLFENVAASLIGIARTALQTNQARAAVHLLVAGKRLINVKKHLFGLIEQKEYERGWAEAKDQLGEPAFEHAISKGEALALKEAVALALKLDL